MGRTLAIGDIHGSLEKLRHLVVKIHWNPLTDTLIFMGDYIDRGPNSAGVIDYLINLRMQSDRIICLRGNHEQLFLDYLEGKADDIYLFNGGMETIRSYSHPGMKIPDAHYRFLKSLPLYHETKEHIFVHAGLRDGIPLSQQDEDDLLWIREEFIYSDYDHGKLVVFGHTPCRSPIIHKNKIGIDTGAIFGGPLTCLDASTVMFYSV